jgi:hypothetical protein
VSVALKSFLDEQNPVDLTKDRPGVRSRGASGPDAIGKRLDLVEDAVELQIRVRITSDFETDEDQVDAFLAVDQAVELRISGKRIAHATSSVMVNGTMIDGRAG